MSATTSANAAIVWFWDENNKNENWSLVARRQNLWIQSIKCGNRFWSVALLVRTSTESLFSIDAVLCVGGDTTLCSFRLKPLNCSLWHRSSRPLSVAACLWLCSTPALASAHSNMWANVKHHYLLTFFYFFVIFRLFICRPNELPGDFRVLFSTIFNNLVCGFSFHSLLIPFST